MLVISANHLPRRWAFTAAWLKPLPVPANQLAIESPLQPQEKMLSSPLWLEHSGSRRTVREPRPDAG